MAQDWKDTLNLPRTEFPMRANSVAREPQRLAHWARLRAYDRAQEQNASGPRFVLHDGPPFTSGAAHIGTAMNKILKDIVVRYRLARGFRAPFVPGWDCHGLPIESKVTAELRKEGRTLATPELREACAQFAADHIETMRGQFQRLGVLGDWENEYKTMKPAYEAEVLRVLAAFVEKGLVYRSKKPVYWSIPCETALAEAEVEYKDHISPSIWVKFSVPAAEAAKFGLAGERPLHAVIWTTTPWTLPSNLAIAVHPEIDYAVVGRRDERYLVAAPMVERFAKETGLEGVEVLQTVKGASLEGLQARHPFIDRASPVVLATYVTTESGTGCVHTAPGHGVEDYQTGLKYKLEIYSPLDDQGRYVADGQVPAELVGVSVLETKGISPANEKVLAMLRDRGALLHHTKYSHSYPHCWRSKTPVIFRAMDQWFISVDRDNLRQKALAAIGEVKWLPAWGENRIRGAVEAKPDWCISRQRQWGLPIPVFYNEDGEALLDAALIRHVAAKVEREGGVNLWWREPAESLLAGYELPAAFRGRKLTKGADTLDVWIESGASHLAVLKAQADASGGWPADLYLEGSDQHRGWFQSSLWTSMVTQGRPPYKTILTHGFVVGQDGRKISKSDGKPQSSDSFVNKYGADVIRLWVASTDFRDDIPVSDQILGTVSDTYRLLRNTLRFQISNLFDFDAARDAVPDAQLDLVDRWALAKTAELVRQCTVAYDACEFHRVYQLCNQFCSVTLSAQYHDILKDRLYTLRADAPLRRSSQTAIHRIFLALARVLAPVLAFTTDEAWAHLTKNHDFTDALLLLQGWPDELAKFADPEAVTAVEQLLKLRGRVYEKVEAARQAGRIGKSLDAAVTLIAPPVHADFALAAKHRDALAELFIVSQVHLRPTEGDDLSIAVDRAGNGRCPRCWRWLEELHGSTENAVLCPRCEDACRGK